MTMMLEHGPYRHFKGGLYTVLFLAERHTHNGDVDVVYIPLTPEHGRMCTRPFRKDSRNEPAWLEEVLWPDGQMRARFMPETSLSQLELDGLKHIWKEQAEEKEKGKW
jgi:hypothetical protein